jgi:hypothetical protein
MMGFGEANYALDLTSFPTILFASNMRQTTIEFLGNL